jgi:alkanesulfonate monooxygenase SsuD/methylene tetrahydromethanopterin reductase-like flavin-dependent oxidoreductase (luciferase family)
VLPAGDALDDVSGGRLTLGLGAGGLTGFDNTVLARGISGQPGPTATPNSVELLHLLLTNESTTWHGAH